MCVLCSDTVCLFLSSVQPVAARGALSMDTEGVGGGGVGIYPPPFMGRRHSHFEDRSAVRNVSDVGTSL